MDNQRISPKPVASGAADRLLSLLQQVLSPSPIGQQVSNGASTAMPLPGWERLTRREQQILYLSAQYLTIAQMADCLHSSPKTVTNQRTVINQKLGLSGAFCLLTFVAEHRHWLISNPPIGEPSYKKGKTLP